MCAIDSRSSRDYPRITLLLGTLNLLAQFAVRYRLALSDEPQRLGNEAHGPPTTKPYVSITLAQRYSEGIPQRNSSRARRFARDVNARHIKWSSPNILRRTVWNRSGGGHGKLIRSRRRKGHLGKGQQVHEARVVLPMATVCSSFGDLSDPNDNFG